MFPAHHSFIHYPFILGTILFLAVPPLATRADVISLSSLDLSNIKQGSDNGASPAPAGIDKSFGGNPLTIAGQKFDRGVGTHAASLIRIKLKKSAQRFSAMVGMDDEAKRIAGKHTVEFQVIGDKKTLWKSPPLKAEDPAVPVDVKLNGVNILDLVVKISVYANGTHADWADAEIEVKNGRLLEVIPTAKEQSGAANVTEDTGAGAGSKTVILSSLDLRKMIQSFQKPQADRSVGGRPLSIAGRKYAKGIGTHAESIFNIDLKTAARRFTASVGVDDEGSGAHGTVEFEVLGDGKLLWDSDIMKAGDPAREVDVDLSHVSTLTLLVSDAGDGDNGDFADWADARIEGDERPEAVDVAKP